MASSRDSGRGVPREARAVLLELRGHLLNRPRDQKGWALLPVIAELIAAGPASSEKNFGREECSTEQ